MFSLELFCFMLWFFGADRTQEEIENFLLGTGKSDWDPDPKAFVAKKGILNENNTLTLTFDFGITV